MGRVAKAGTTGSNRQGGYDVREGTQRGRGRDNKVVKKLSMIDCKCVRKGEDQL